MIVIICLIISGIILIPEKPNNPIEYPIEKGKTMIAEKEISTDDMIELMKFHAENKNMTEFNQLRKEYNQMINRKKASSMRGFNYNAGEYDYSLKEERERNGIAPICR